MPRRMTPEEAEKAQNLDSKEPVSGINKPRSTVHRALYEELRILELPSLMLEEIESRSGHAPDVQLRLSYEDAEKVVHALSSSRYC